MTQACTPLDCSTKYQVVMTYQALKALPDALSLLPKDLVAIVAGYVIFDYTRAEELFYGNPRERVWTHVTSGVGLVSMGMSLFRDVLKTQSQNDQPRFQAEPNEVVKRQWTNLRNARDPLFYAIALETDLFRFVARGATLPQAPEERFRIVEERINQFYPRKYGRYVSSKNITIDISPLDLPRLPTRVFNRSFNPYRPTEWGKMETTRTAQGMWTHPETYVTFCDSNERTFSKQYHPPHDIPQSEGLFLAPFMNGPDVFCPLVIQSWPDPQHRFKDQGGLLDGNCNLHVPDSSHRSTPQQQVYLPIARVIVESSGYCEDDIVDWALTHNSIFPDFVYFRTRMKPVAPTQANSAATAASTSPAMASVFSNAASTPPAHMSEARAVAADAHISTEPDSTPPPSELMERRYFK